MINLVGFLISAALLVASAAPLAGCWGGEQEVTGPNVIQTRDGRYITMIDSLAEAPDRCDAVRADWPTGANQVYLYIDARPAGVCDR